MDARIEYVSLDDIVAAPRNPKDHDIGALVESMRRFGFVAPLLLDEASGRLVAGHGRLEALRCLQAENSAPSGIQVDGVDWRVPVIRGLEFRSPAEAEAYLIADNRLSELGGWDEHALAQVLTELHEQEALAGTGYDADDLDAMIAKLEGDLAVDDPTAPDQFKEFDDESIETEYRCPSCGYEWSGKAK